MNVSTEHIAAKDIHVDPDAQRSLRPSWRDEIAKNFDPSKLGVIHVAPNGDGYRAMDGQHRVEAMKKLGLGQQELLCVVYHGLDQQDEASIFLGLNNSKQVRAYDKFRVRVTEGDPEAVEIIDILGQVGLKLSDQKGNGAVTAVKQIENVYTGRTLKLKDGPYPYALLWTLSTLRDAWGYDANAFEGSLIEGLGAVMLRFGTRIDRERLSVKLARRSGGPYALIADAKGWKDIKRTTLKNAVAELVIEVHNNQLRGNALPAWDRA